MISVAQNLLLEWHRISTSRINVVQYISSIVENLEYNLAYSF